MSSVRFRVTAAAVALTFSALLGLPLAQAGAAPAWHVNGRPDVLPTVPAADRLGVVDQSQGQSTPGAPSIRSLTPGQSSFTVSWSRPSSGGRQISDYTVRYATTPSPTTWSTVLTHSTGTSYTVSSLSSASSYYVEVAAINNSGTGQWSAEAGPVTPLGSATVPGAPTITSATAQVGAVALAWNAPTNTGGSAILSYIVQDSTTGGTSWTTVATPTGRSATVTGLSSSTSYVFQVAAVNSVGPGAYSAPSASIKPLPGATVPGAPTVTGVVAGTGSVQVSWSAPSSNGGASITSYSVRDSSNGGSTWSTATTTATASPYTVTGLSSGSSYVFEVAAANSVGTGAWSAPSNAVSPLSGDNGIEYHGGPVLTNGVHVYEIWYGNWSTASTPAREHIVDTFLHGIGGTPYFNMNSSYYNAANQPVQNVVTVNGSVAVSGSTSLSENSIAGIAATEITSGALPNDPNGIYFVFTADNVKVGGFLTQYCGFHGGMTVGSTTTQYAFVGDPTGSSVSACSGQLGSTPNNDLGGDDMVSVIAHETSEATTDPQLNAWWQSSSGEENGDLCAWNFGTVFVANNGTSYANVSWSIGGTTYQYLIQQIWVNASGGYCGLSYP